MAHTFFKPLTERDRTSSRTLLHEAIPITGTLIARAEGNVLGYSNGSDGREINVKTFSHGMFQSVYDYPYLSSSANHIFDIAVGWSAQSSSAYAVSPAIAEQKDKKANVYAQMAQVLNGYTTSGEVRAFDQDGSFGGDGGKKHTEVFFLNFSRLLVKDEIKKGSFEIQLGIASGSAEGNRNPNSTILTVTDAGAETNYKTNSPAGEYGILKRSGGGGHTEAGLGLIYYQAGVVVLTGSVFGPNTSFTTSSATSGKPGQLEDSFKNMIVSASINKIADGIRTRIKNISFNNTTELNSAIYFCRANHNEFNYSSNPTYLSESKIHVKSNDILQPPRAYVTTVGLYSADNELLAVAKLSEPLRKDPTNELTLRVRLDY